MSYSITYRDGSVDYDYGTFSELSDAREAYEKAIEEIQDAESIKLVDQAGETIESHFF
ncbi:hypothetical protein MITS9509_01087 [Synechococcus sp. MIT S9509]|nr:hypothetical protein MITS9509_01087 [Synechococcus sp. MIT S9509]